MSTKKVWYITGASKGLGLTLVKKLLDNGDRVAATSRSVDALIEAVGLPECDMFLPLSVDLTDCNSIWQSVQQTNAKFGGIDVAVNNAGYGIGGTIEELDEKDIRDNFEVNVFATINVIKDIMPIMRKQRSGHIINISSIAGFAAGTGWGIYAATKFAVTGMSEVLAEEVKPFGVNVTVVMPGAFRTEFLSDDSLMLTKHPIADYQSVRDTHARFLKMNGNQAGDPEKAADVFIALTEMEEPPVRLFLGSDAYKRASAKVELLDQGLKRWQDTSYSTDFNQELV